MPVGIRRSQQIPSVSMVSPPAPQENSSFDPPPRRSYMGKVGEMEEEFLPQLEDFGGGLEVLEGQALERVKKGYRALIVSEFLESRPALSIWPEWSRALAYKLNCPVKWVSQALAQYADLVESGMKTEGYKQAQALAKAVGVGMVDVLRVHKEAMAATRPVTLTVTGTGEDGRPDFGVEVEVPDHKIRLQAAHQHAQVMAMYAPQKVDVVHDITDAFAEMSENELKAEGLKLIGRFIEIAKDTGASAEEIKGLIASNTR